MSFRTVLISVANAKMYSEIGEKECLVEEIGTMGSMVCSDERAADFARVTLFLNYINKTNGVMWWCAFDQSHLDFLPYSSNMCEVELGIADKDRKAKPVLKEFKKFAAIKEHLSSDFLSPNVDAVCILTRGQDQWGIAYMTYCLALQAGVNIQFAYGDNSLPECNVYIMPSISGTSVMPMNQYHKLRSRIENGATLYISHNDGIISEFESLTGICVEDTCCGTEGYMTLGNEKIKFFKTKDLKLVASGAEILATDENDNPMLTLNRFGKGKVYYLNFPLEMMLLQKKNAFENTYYKIYSMVFDDSVQSHPVVCDDQYIVILTCESKNGFYISAFNCSNAIKKPKLKIREGYKITKTLYGNKDSINPFDAVIFKLEFVEA